MPDILPQSIQNFLIQLLLFVLLLFILWVLRRLIFSLISYFMRGLFTRLHKTELFEPFREILHLPYNLIFVAVVVLALALLVDDPSISQLFVVLSQTLLIASVTLFLSRLVAALFADAARLKALTGMTVSPAAIPFIRSILILLTATFGILIIFETWGINVSALVAGLGIGALGITLAAQDLLTNMFGFAAINGDHPFKIGDYIVTPNVEGTVESIGMRSTRIRHIDQSFITVPNNMLVTVAVSNQTHLQMRVVDLVVGLPYQTSADEIEKLVNAVQDLLANDPVVDNTNIRVFFSSIGSQSLEVMIRFYILRADWMEFAAERQRLLLAIKRLLDSLHAHITSVQNTLYLAQSSRLGQLPDEQGDKAQPS